MVIEDNRNSRNNYYYELECGDVFEDADGIYIKVTEGTAFELIEDKIVTFPSHSQVKVLNAKIVIEG